MLLNDLVRDNGLAYVTANGARMDLCNAEPSTYAQATSTFSIANKTGVAAGSPEAGDVSGRKVVAAAVSAGTVTANDTGTHWAYTDGASVLIATAPVTAPQAVLTSNPWNMGAVDIEMEAAVAA